MKGYLIINGLIAGAIVAVLGIAVNLISMVFAPCCILSCLQYILAGILAALITQMTRHQLSTMDGFWTGAISGLAMVLFNLILSIPIFLIMFLIAGAAIFSEAQDKLNEALVGAGIGVTAIIIIGIIVYIVVGIIASLLNGLAGFVYGAIYEGTKK